MTWVDDLAPNSYPPLTDEKKCNDNQRRMRAEERDASAYEEGYNAAIAERLADRLLLQKFADWLHRL